MCIVSVLCLSLVAIGQNCLRLDGAWEILRRLLPIIFDFAMALQSNLRPTLRNFISKSVVEIPLRIKIEFLLSSNSNSPLSTWAWRTHKKSLSTLLESNGLELYFFGALTLIQCWRVASECDDGDFGSLQRWSSWWQSGGRANHDEALQLVGSKNHEQHPRRDLNFHQDSMQIKDSYES